MLALLEPDIAGLQPMRRRQPARCATSTLRHYHYSSASLASQRPTQRLCDEADVRSTTIFASLEPDIAGLQPMQLRQQARSADSNLTR